MKSLAALLFLVMGVPHAARPSEFAKLREQLDSIRSRRSPSAGEPTERAVTGVRARGAGLGLAGAATPVAG
jgi:hypothetical protein